MKTDLITTDYLFDLKNILFADIFTDHVYPFEIIKTLSKYIDQKFESGELTLNYKNKKNIFIGDGTIIQEGVEIIGPAIIGRNCFIGHASLLREYCLIGDNVHIGHGVEMKHSVVLNNSSIAHLNYVGDSVIGNNVNISGGAMLANYRLDKKEILLKVNNETVRTDLKKLGAMIGDNSNIGVNVVLNPGTVLGKNTIVYPLMSVIGIHQSNEIIK